MLDLSEKATREQWTPTAARSPLDKAVLLRLLQSQPLGTDGKDDEQKVRFQSIDLPDGLQAINPSWSIRPAPLLIAEALRSHRDRRWSCEIDLG